MKREDGYYWATYFGHDKIVKLTTVRPNYQIYYLIDESKFCLEEDLETIDEHPIKRFAEANANTVLGDERANYENAIYDLIFAYANKDDNMPHAFEHDAIITGYNLLTKAHQREFAKKILDDMERLFT